MNSDPTQDVIEAWVRLARTTQSVLDDIAGELKRAKLPPLTWYDVLHELASSAPDGLRPFELVERNMVGNVAADDSAEDAGQQDTSRPIAQQQWVDSNLEDPRCDERSRQRHIDTNVERCVRQ